MPDRLFVYGTLAEPATFGAVTGRDYAFVDGGDPPEEGIYATPARLEGYAAVCLDGRYLYAVAREGASITGRLLHRLDPEVLRRLDRYEGSGYRRCIVIVRAAAHACDAYVYVSATEPVPRVGD